MGNQPITKNVSAVVDLLREHEPQVFNNMKMGGGVGSSGAHLADTEMLTSGS